MVSEIEKHDEPSSSLQPPTGEGKSHRKTSITMSYLHLDPDKVLSAFGKFGRYQMFAYFMTNVVSLLYVMNMMVMPFITEEPKFGCRIKHPEGVSWEYETIDKCSVRDSNNWTIKCLNIPGAKYEYEGEVHGSLASEFDLVCDDFSATEHASSIFLVGGMVASPLVTQLSDIVGRRATFLLPLYLSVASNLLASIAPTYTTFLILRFLSGFGTVGFVQTAYVLCTESVSTKFRDLTPALPTFFWVVGYTLSGVGKLFISDWRWLYFAISIPGILTIPLWWFLPESIHWLINNEKHEKVKKYINTSMRINKMQICLKECKSADITKNSKKRTLLDLFRHRALFFQLCLNAFVLTVMNGTYWALSLFSTDLSEDKMTGFFLSGFVELPAGILGTYLMVKMPRRVVSCLSLLLQGLAMICALYVPGSKTVKMIFPLAAKSFNGIAWAVHPLMVSEMAPTTVRNSFSGIVSFIADIGSVLAPYLKRLEAIHESAPALIIAVMSFMAAAMVLLMPETKDKKMPDDLDAFDAGPLASYFQKKERGNKGETSILLEVIPEDRESGSSKNDVSTSMPDLNSPQIPKIITPEDEQCCSKEIPELKKLGDREDSHSIRKE